MKETLNAHIKEIHPDKKNEKCFECKYESYQSSRLRAHIRSKHELEYKTCKYCKNDYKYLDEHVEQSHLEEAEKFNCNLCDYLTVGKERLNTHMQRNHKIRRGSYE